MQVYILLLMRKLLLFFVLSIFLLAVYALPTAIAKFVGSHTFETGANGVGGLKCQICHDYIVQEFQATTETNRVLQIHNSSASNWSYTQGWLNITPNTNQTQGVCMLCHRNQLSATPSHTKVTIRVCTDLDCHGNNATTNNTAYPVEGLMGPRLGGSDESDPTNAHMRVFNSLSGNFSFYYNETGTNYTEGVFLCLGCHTFMDFELSVNGSESYNHSDFSSSKRRYL
jgi:hypothetical protein